ncbi:MAG: pantetheine-phosphate adenylyltransferase [Clostridia bacterium]|nr:pantetheine-phosphate adenylyltransferase [Clostridia bacterium]
MKKCLFAGSFDPFTVGHADVVAKALALFDEVVIAIMVNPEKTYTFTLEERLSFIRTVYEGQPRVRVIAEEGLAAEVCEKVGASFYVRGIRNGSDYDYETANYYAAKRFVPNLQTVYFPAEKGQMDVSSSVVKTLMKNGKPYGEFLPVAIRKMVASAWESKQK